MRGNTKFKSARLNAELTQKELAKRLGIKRIYVAKLESGDRNNPSSELIKKIRAVLGEEAIKDFI